MAWRPAYATVEELRDYVRISDSHDDAVLSLAIEAASRAVDKSTNRQFGKVDAPEQRLYAPDYHPDRRRWIIGIDDLMTQVGLQISTDAGTVDAFKLEPRNAAQEGRPWTMVIVDPTSTHQPVIDQDVAVTASWGWAGVPNTIKQATLLQASRFFSRRTSPYGVAGSPELGNELRLLSKVDADVDVMISSFRRWWSAA